MEIMKGAAVSAEIKKEVQETLSKMSGYVPTLAIIRVGNRLDDIAYERGAVKKMEAFGLKTMSFGFEENISDSDFKEKFKKINQDPRVDGILLLRPLPRHIVEKDVLRMISPEKDLDCISPENLGRVFTGEGKRFSPCTAESVVEILKAHKVQIQGKHVVIVGRSLVVGRPLAMLMLREDATVTICHTKTENLKEVCSHADILVVAAGEAKLITDEYIREGAVVVDVGINVDKEGHLCGDVDFNSVEKKASMVTPVPGGIGAITTAILARHLTETVYHNLV